LKTTKNREIVIVYTKQFPFGFKEAYILDEIEALSIHFDAVYFLPYAEFSFTKTELRIPIGDNFHFLDFGAKRPIRRFQDKVKAILNILTILTQECIFSRQKKEAFLRLKQNFIRLYHYSWIAEQLHTWMNNQEANITHYHYWMHDGVMIDKMASRDKEGIHIARSHSIDCYHKDWPLPGYAAYEIQKIQYLNAIFSVSQHGLNHLNQTFPNFQHKFHYQPLGIPILDVRISNSPKPVILTIAFMGKVKNMHRMIDLMEELKSEFEWVHIGSGVQNIHDEIKSLCQLKNIPFTSLGYLNKSQIFDYLKNNSVAFFANTSIWEGVPVSLMEAGLHGVPMIVTDIPGNKEVVNEKNGVVIPLVGDLKFHANKIRAIYTNSEVWKSYAHEAHLTIMNHYNAEKNHLNFFSEIKKLSLK
jgi:glycosyltransferase involved in cell wall biosynthesis